LTDAWRETLLAEGATLQDAVRSLDRSGLQIALVVDADERLRGTITDGDIRRALLRGTAFDASASGIMQPEPFAVPPDLSLAAVEGLMQANKIFQLPVIDDRRRVIGLHVWGELHEAGEKPNLFVVMAGGEGVRLRPDTEACPKPMLEVGGKPMLEHIIARARHEGFRRIVLTVHYLGHMIEEYFGDGSAFDVRIDYVREPSPLGTGGALTLIDPVPDRPFVVTNGDVLSDVRYGEMLAFHERHKAVATMGVRLHQWQHPFGVVRTAGLDIVEVEEKPVHRTNVNAGIYVFSPAAIGAMEKGKYCDMPSLFQRLQERGERAIAFPMHEQWLDVGRHDDLEIARQNHESGK